MPFRRSYRPRRTLRKPFRSRRRVYKRSSRNLRSVKQGNAFPDRSLVKMRYADNYEMNSVGGISSQIWRVNSIFDPDSTGVGHQPYSHDQWAALYNEYNVHGVKVDLRLTNNSSTVPMDCVFYFNNNGTAIGKMSTAKEKPYSSHRLLGVSTGNNTATISRYVNLKKLYGNGLQTTNFRTVFGTSPDGS